MKSLMARLILWVGFASTLCVQTALADDACAAHYDYGADGRNDETHEFYYANGRLDAEAVYRGGSARPASITEYVYDARGRLWGKAIDLNGDGKGDRRLYYAYARNGDLSAEAVDEGADGSFDRMTSYSYAGACRLGEIDSNMDGRSDRRERLCSEYGAHGKLARELYDDGANGSIDRITEHDYDDRGRLANSYVDEGANGSIDLYIQYEYDDCDG